MLLSHKWLQEFLDKKIPCQNLDTTISLKVAEVEQCFKLYENLTEVKTVKVLQTTKHPHSDRLQLALIDDGTTQIEIVCGASNCRAGIIVPFAPLGAKLSFINKEGVKEYLTIKKTLIRKVESCGMLCAASELGLEEQSDGLLELDESTPLGVLLNTIAPFNSLIDTLLEIDNKSLTHRPDLWGHYGFARELSAIFDCNLKEYTTSAITINTNNNHNIKSNICRRYSSLIIENIKVEDSPLWLQERLKSLNMASINNIVDITNYILLELGQPMHAFDLDYIKNSPITIRNSQDNEKFIALNDEEYILNDDLVIANDNEVLALAGIMGGKNSAINTTTCNIMLEAANFDASSIRKSSNRLNLRSDSSLRFEKSLDPENTILALNKAAELILQICPDAIIKTIDDKFPNPYQEITIQTSYSFINKILGCNIEKSFIDNQLSKLGFLLQDDLTIQVPSWRRTKDISIAEDIVEEVGRLHGFDNIEEKQLVGNITPLKPNQNRLKERLIKNILKYNNFDEVLHYPWTGEKMLDFYGLNSENYMELANAISIDAKFMRQEAMPHLIESVALNLKNYNSFKIFELGRVYHKKENDILADENFVLSCAIIPPYEKNSIQEESFYEAKNLIDTILKATGINTYQIEKLTNKQAWIHPNINAQLMRGRDHLASLYKLHPLIAKKLKIKHNVYLIEINLNKIFTSKKKYSYKSISKFPSVTFDVTVLANKFENASTIEKIITKVSKGYLKEIKVFDIYHGEELPKDTKAISFKIVFAKDTKTLDSSEIETLQNNIMQSLEKNKFPIR